MTDEVSHTMVGQTLYTFKRLRDEPIFYAIIKDGTSAGACSINGDGNFEVFNRFGSSIQVTESKPEMDGRVIVDLPYYSSWAAWRLHDVYQR